MIDREKVINGLKILKSNLPIIDLYGYGDHNHFATAIVNDAITLLEKQEPKKPMIDTIGQPVCPHKGCHHRLSLMLKQKYCDQCGQAVKWDE